MIDAILLDTHIALWLDSGSDRLRPSTRGLIDGIWRNGGTVFISAVTAWEIAVNHRLLQGFGDGDDGCTLPLLRRELRHANFPS